MAKFDFLVGLPIGTCTILVLLPDGTFSRISGLSHLIISNACPLLGYALTDGPSSGYQATIQAEAVTSVTSFLRYLYLGSYLTTMETYTTTPISLLRHVEVYKLAKYYDVPQLQQDAYLNFLCELESSLSRPEPPPHLCEAVRFIYKHLPDEDRLVDHLTNYCVQAFKYHALGSDENFRKTAYEIPEFDRELCRANYDRNFEDEGASGIVSLPSPPSPQLYGPFDYPQRGKKRTHNVDQALDWYDSDNTESDSLPEGLQTKRPKSALNEAVVLVHRPKDTSAPTSTSDNDTWSEEEGFTLVYRPKIVSSGYTTADAASDVSDDGSNPTSDVMRPESPRRPDDQSDSKDLDTLPASLLEARNNDSLAIEELSSAEWASVFDSMSLPGDSDDDASSEWFLI